MGYRTLSISIFIVFVVFWGNVSNLLADINPSVNNTFGKLEEVRGINELPVDDDVRSVTNLTRNRAGDEQSPGELLLSTANFFNFMGNIFFDSTVGIGTFVGKMIHIDNYDHGTAERVLLDFMLLLILAFVNVNHAIAAVQLLPGYSLGGKL
jgi:hypothetical protein